MTALGAGPGEVLFPLPRILRVIGALGDDRRPVHVAQDLDLDFGSKPGEIGLDHRQRQRLVHSEAETAIGGTADELAARIEGLGAARVGIGDALKLKRYIVPVETLLAAFDQGVATGEVALVGMYESVEARFIGRIFDRQLARDQAIALLDRKRRHRLDAIGANAEFAACLHQEIEERHLLLDRMMEFEAELADEIDPERMGGDWTDIDLPAPQPREG